jgi:hypothetical protein
MSNDEPLPASDLNLDDLIPPGFADEMEFPDDDEVIEGVIEETEESEETEEELPRRGSSLFNTCTKVYEAMHERSTVVHEGRMYKGRISSLFGELDVSVGVYSAVMKRLKSMGCIDQIARGGGGRPSIFLLHVAPTYGAFEGTRDGGYISKDRASVGELQAIVTLLSQRVAQLEGQMANMIEWRHQQVYRQEHADKVLAFKDVIQPNAKGL